MNRRSHMLTIWFLIPLLLLTFCNSGKEKLKIGVIAPLTGEAATYGKAMKNGLDLAIEECNVKGGVNDNEIELIYEDSKADPKTAILAFNKLININKVSIIIGDMFSHTTLSIAPLAEKSGITLISPTASAEEIPKTGSHIFSIYPSDTYDGKFIANFVIEHIKKKKAAIINAQASAMVNVKDAFKKTFTSLTGEVIFVESYSPKHKDFRSILAKIKPLKLDIIFIAGYLEEIVIILKQAREIGIKDMQFITISTAYDEKLFSLAGDASEGLIFSAPFFDENIEEDIIVKFVENFKNKYGITPNVWAAYGYDVLNITIYSYKNSVKNKTSLSDEISKIENFKGVTGKTTFNKKREVIKQLRMLMVKNQKFVELN